MFGLDRIEYKTIEQIRKMRSAGLIVSAALSAARTAAIPGVTTRHIDAVAAEVINEHGALPSFLGYQGFPATVCVSVNDEVVHGIPGDRIIQDGDLVSIDCGAIVDGWHADAAITVLVGTVTPEHAALSEATQRSLWAGIAAIETGKRLCVVGAAVESSIESESAGSSYGIVEEYVGHGIGSQMHQAPDVPNFRTKERFPKIKPGLCIAIEPMVTLGDPRTQVLEDDWTVVTDIGGFAAHWEHSIAVLDDGLFVLTAEDGGAKELAKRGIALGTLG